MCEESRFDSRQEKKDLSLLQIVQTVSDVYLAFRSVGTESKMQAKNKESYTAISVSHNVARDWLQQCDALEYMNEKFRVSEGNQNVLICGGDYICGTTVIWTNIYVVGAHT